MSIRLLPKRIIVPLDGSKLAESVLADIHIKTLRGADRMYYYEDGIYKDGGEERVKVKCMEKLSDVFKINYSVKSRLSNPSGGKLGRCRLS